MLTPQQQAILALAKENGGRVTSAQVIEVFGPNYYCGESKYLGAMLSRMVKTGLLVREKPGVFAIGSGKKPVPAVAVNPIQTTLF